MHWATTSTPRSRAGSKLVYHALTRAALSLRVGLLRLQERRELVSTAVLEESVNFAGSSKGSDTRKRGIPRPGSRICQRTGSRCAGTAAKVGGGDVIGARFGASRPRVNA